MTTLKDITENKNDINLNKCVLVKNILDKALCKFLSIQMELDSLDEGKNNSNQVPGSEELYDTTAAKIVNNIVLEKIKTLLELKNIYSTYSFYRKYYKYQELTRHTDRPECELSISICLDMQNKDDPWELFFENSEQNTTYVAKPQIGDGVIYMGMDVPHWREKCPQNWLKQLFLHYSFNATLEFDLCRIKEKEEKEKIKLTKTLIKLLAENN